MDFTQITVFQDAQGGMSHFCHFASNILVNLCEATVFFHLKHAHVQDGPSMTKSDQKELHHQKKYQEIETPSKISKQAISCANQGDSTSTTRLKSVELVTIKDSK